MLGLPSSLFVRVFLMVDAIAIPCYAKGRYDRVPLLTQKPGQCLTDVGGNSAESKSACISITIWKLDTALVR
ncbi:hypothetical protein F4678DRAFT_421962 [Xylaria arbuscula]|nr:hypothetical protein F4678DRAFT_421962 [Xylaria arbuscula]